MAAMFSVFGSEGSSRYAVRFWIGPFPVAIEPSFWVVALAPALYGGSTALELLWGLALLLSILVHELGHAFASWAFGFDAWIQLYAFGGRTYHPSAGRRAQLFISLAGPVAGFLLGAVVFASARLLPDTAWPYAHAFYSMMMWLNFGWGLVNLLPVLPLDGGHVLENALGPWRRYTVLLVSTGVGALATALAVLWHYSYPAALFGVLTILNGYALSQEERPRRLRPRSPGRPAPVPPLQESDDPAQEAFWRARRLAREGDSRAAARALVEAIQAGFEDLEAIKQDPDLEHVRREPEIAALLDPLGLKTTLH